jgi:hypothetical protein
MGCHGGAGVTTLAKLGIGQDAGWRRWPEVTTTPAGLLLVARMSAWGLRSAYVAAETCMSPRKPPEYHLLGLIVVAAKPGRQPKVARERLELVAGWVPAVFEVPWVTEALETDSDAIAQCEPLRKAIPEELTQLVQSITTGSN